MSEIINGYELLEPFQNRNAGFCRWTYAEKNGKGYFLKEFLDPVYPIGDSISQTLKKERVIDCGNYVDRKMKIYQAINDASDGNLVRIAEFFQYDSHFYIATERITDGDLTIYNLQTLPRNDRIMLCLSIAHSMMMLHENKVVHADIKPSNIIVRKTDAGKLAGKIIDFDGSFFETDPPAQEDELCGDQVYLAPESCRFICGEEVELTCKLDVFALGLIFHQYLTGAIPDFDTEEYDYAFEAVLDGQELRIASSVPDWFASILKEMLEGDPAERASSKKVYYMIREHLFPSPKPVPAQEMSPRTSHGVTPGATPGVTPGATPGVSSGVMPGVTPGTSPRYAEGAAKAPVAGAAAKAPVAGAAAGAGFSGAAHRRPDLNRDLNLDMDEILMDETTDKEFDEVTPMKKTDSSDNKSGSWFFSAGDLSDEMIERSASEEAAPPAWPGSPEWDSEEENYNEGTLSLFSFSFKDGIPEDE